jgi:plastocyanin
MPPRLHPALLASLAAALPVPVHSVWQQPSRHSRDQIVQPAASPDRAPVRTPTPAKGRTAAKRRTNSRAHHVVVAFPAGDPGTTISDFRFAPATITVHAGQTVTWINRGPSTHTATARDRSFNSGPLKPGASSSHTFTQAGTYNYFCQIHTFMHGTVVVLATAPAPAQPKSKQSTPAAATPGKPGRSKPQAAQKASTRPTLPVTGLDLAATAATAAMLLLGGLLLRANPRP